MEGDGGGKRKMSTAAKAQCVQTLKHKLEKENIEYGWLAEASVFPALLHSLTHAFDVFPTIVFVQVRSFDVCGR